MKRQVWTLTEAKPTSGGIGFENQDLPPVSMGSPRNANAAEEEHSNRAGGAGAAATVRRKTERWVLLLRRQARGAELYS